MSAEPVTLPVTRERPIGFRSPEHQAQFERCGFVKVPFLDDVGLAELRALWQEVGPEGVRGIYSNIHDLPPEVNRRVDRTIRRLFAGPADAVLVDARLGGASFLVKGTGPDSASTPHQDWNNVEEQVTESLSIWVSLVDVDETNGALQVIPGSHRTRPSVRSLDTPSLYLDFTEELEPHLEAVPARAGEAVFYAHNLFHGSKPNLSDRIRVSAVAGVTHVDSRLVHYRHVAGASADTFEVFEVESDFYFSGIPDMAEGRTPPTARPVGQVDVANHQLEPAEVLAAAYADGGSMSTLPPTLVDEALEAELEQTGWVVVPLLDDDEVAHLRDFYRSHAADGSQNPDGAYNPTYAEFSVIHSTPEFRADAYREIVDVVAVRAQEWLRSFRPLVANFVNKLPGQGVVPMHQNWSVVDESRFRSVSVWVALVDCTVDNGTLELLAGSHRDFRDPRGMWAYEAFADVADDVHELLDRVEVAAGQAIILDDAVVHFSPPNDSTTDRLAIQLIMVPEAATPRFFQRVDVDDDQMVVDVWEVEERFFWDFWHGEGDKRFGTVVDRIRLPSARVGAREFARRYTPQSQ